MNKIIFASVDAYIASFPRDVQKKLRDLRATVKAAAPKAEEKISYNMPAYKLNGSLVYFAAYPKHIGLYDVTNATRAFESELADYKNDKGNLIFPLAAPLPLKLITKVVKFRVAENTKTINKK